LPSRATTMARPERLAGEGVPSGVALMCRAGHWAMATRAASWRRIESL
jgi:hypothetical protein